MPYIILYLVCYTLLLAEVVLVTLRLEGIGNVKRSLSSSLLNSSSSSEEFSSEEVDDDDSDEDLEDGDEAVGGLEDLVWILTVALAVLLGLMVVSNIYSIGQIMGALLLSQRGHLHRTMAKHNLTQTEGEY